jgi:hypothetical protein
VAQMENLRMVQMVPQGAIPLLCHNQALCQMDLLVRIEEEDPHFQAEEVEVDSEGDTRVVEPAWHTQ